MNSTEINENKKCQFVLYIISCIICLIEIIAFICLSTQVFTKKDDNLILDWKNAEFRSMYKVICILGLLSNIALFIIGCLLIYKFHKGNYSELLQNVNINYF